MTDRAVPTVSPGGVLRSLDNGLIVSIARDYSYDLRLATDAVATDLRLLPTVRRASWLFVVHTKEFSNPFTALRRYTQCTQAQSHTNQSINQNAFI